MCIPILQFNRLGKWWSRISRETGLKIGPAFSRALKCEKCRTKKSVKVKHFRLVLSVFTKVYRSEYFVPTLTCLYWFYYLQLAYFIHKMYNIFYILFLSLASLAFLARHLKLVSQSRETWKVQDFAKPNYNIFSSSEQCGCSAKLLEKFLSDIWLLVLPDEYDVSSNFSDLTIYIWTWT